MSEQSALRMGAPASDIIFEIRRRNPEIAVFEFVIYANSLPLEQRLEPTAAPALLEVLERAREQRLGLDVRIKPPYWSTTLSVDMGVPELDFFLRHALADHARQRSVAMDAGDLSPTTIGALAATLVDGEQLGLSSICRLRDGSTAHIPMLDYRLPPEPTAVHRVRRVLVALEQRESVIVASGRSFHTWGIGVVPTQRFHEMLGRALLLSPLIDDRFIARALQRGYAALRILPGSQKAAPVVAGVHQLS
jgi:hypothetical protein